MCPYHKLKIAEMYIGQHINSVLQPQLLSADEKHYLLILMFSFFFLLREKSSWYTLAGINLPAGTRQQRNTEVSRINSGTMPAGKQAHHRKSRRWVLQLSVMPTHCLCVVGLTGCQNCSKSEHLPLKRRPLRLLVEIHIQYIPNTTLSRQTVTESMRKYAPSGNTSHWVLLIWHTSVWGKEMQFALSETCWVGWEQRLKEPFFNKNNIRWSCVQGSG